MPHPPDEFTAVQCLDRVETLHDELLLARRRVEKAEHTLAGAITQAIAHRCSWADLGAAMGIRRQTAWDWYQRHHREGSHHG